MVNDHASPLFTSSQESEMMHVVQGLDLQDLDHLFTQETLKQEYDIPQHLSAQQQQQQQQQEQAAVLSGQMPVNEEFGGYLDFQLVPDQQEDTKAWVYSQKLKKVYIEMDKTLPVRIKWSPQCSGLFIKAVMAYCQPTHRSEPVTRCHNHIALSNPESPHLRHVLGCKHSNAVYDNTNGFYSVVVPLGTPQPGSDSVQMDFVFHCKNSCSTGINRRPTEVVFNLINDTGEVLGRRKLSVRICSCPKRDRDKEEKPLRENTVTKKRKLNTGKKIMPIYRPQPLIEPESEIFEFSARICGRDNYEMLKRIAYGLMAGKMELEGLQSTIRPLLDELNRMR